MNESTNDNETTQFKLYRSQKDAIGVLSMGTFLEYFDLMLYVHMAVLLNELFFPKTDPYTASLLSAFAFCSTYIFRPIGALIIGKIGDTIGRKQTVIITTFLMAGSCLTMATLPTYAQIGITASWIITICRVVQGISSMGEIVGASIYLTEIVRPPIQYPVVASLDVFNVLGGVFALLIASIVTISDNNTIGWRAAFLFGAFIAVTGSVARRTLRETPEFADAKLKIRRKIEDNIAKMNEKDGKFHKEVFKQKVNKKTTLAYFLLNCTKPVCFYFSYVYCGNILKYSCGFTAEQIIHQNLMISFFDLAGYSLLVYLSTRFFPLNILKIKAVLALMFILICPYLLIGTNNSSLVFIIQAISIFLTLSVSPADPIFYRHFPVMERFTSVSVIFALSRALMFPVTSFGLVYFIEKLGYWGMHVIMIPVIIGYLYGVNHFQHLENEREKELKERAKRRPANSNKKQAFGYS